MKKGTLGKSWNYIKTRTIVLFFPRTSLLCERDSNTWPFHIRGYVYRIEGPTTYFHPYRLWFVRLWVHHSLFVRLVAHIHGVYVLINKKKSPKDLHICIGPAGGRYSFFFWYSRLMSIGAEGIAAWYCVFPGEWFVPPRSPYISWVQRESHVVGICTYLFEIFSGFHWTDGKATDCRVEYWWKHNASSMIWRTIKRIPNVISICQYKWNTDCVALSFLSCSTHSN